MASVGKARPACLRALLVGLGRSLQRFPDFTTNGGCQRRRHRVSDLKNEMKNVTLIKHKTNYVWGFVGDYNKKDCYFANGCTLTLPSGIFRSTGSLPTFQNITAISKHTIVQTKKHYVNRLRTNGKLALEQHVSCY